VRTADSATRARLVRDMQENMRRRGGPATLLITGGRVASTRGKTLAQVAEARAKTPIDAAIDIILAGDASVASFNMRDDDIERFMKEPWVATGSDGSDGHPRKYGTFPRLFATYFREKHVLTMSQAVARSSAQTARALGLSDRGTIRDGWIADIVVFDPETIVDRSTYEQPTRLAEGVKYVLVNGVVAVDGGHVTGKLAGRALRKHATPDATP